MAKRALIVGAGEGISASFARLLAANGVEVALAARRPDKLAALREEIGARAFACDAAEADAVERLYGEIDQKIGALDIVLYNPSYRTRGPLIELDPGEVQRTLMISAYGGFLVAQAAARSCSPAPRRASRVTPAPRPSPWASSRCAVSPRASRASWRRTTSTSPIS